MTPLSADIKGQTSLPHTIIVLLKLLKGLSFQGLLWSDVILDSDWLLFVILDVLKYSIQSRDSLSYGKSNPWKDRHLKSYSKTIIAVPPCPTLKNIIQMINVNLMLECECNSIHIPRQHDGLSSFFDCQNHTYFLHIIKMGTINTLHDLIISRQQRACLAGVSAAWGRWDSGPAMGQLEVMSKRSWNPFL